MIRLNFKQAGRIIITSRTITAVHVTSRENTRRDVSPANEAHATHQAALATWYVYHANRGVQKIQLVDRRKRVDSGFDRDRGREGITNPWHRHNILWAVGIRLNLLAQVANMCLHQA